MSIYAGVGDKYTGTWEGKLSIPGGSLRLVLHVKVSTDGKMSGTVDSPDQGVNGLLVDKFNVKANSFSFEISQVNGKYAGTLSEDQQMLNGKWSQNGSELSLNLKKEAASPEKEASGQPPLIDSMQVKPFIGIWEGKLELPGASLRLAVHISFSDGVMNATLDSPDQGVKGIVASKVEINGKKIVATLNSIGGTYSGELNAEGSVLEGSWTQMNVTTVLDLKKTDKVSEIKRPQEPKRPFPYNEEEVTFVNRKDGDTLAGTFTWPKSGSNFPVAVFVTGSGPQNRDEELLGHKPFLVISDYLTRNGIATLRYDDRGFAKSTGNFATGTTLDFAEDALAAVDYLKTRKEINREKIGIIGHSEGGIIAPIVASRTSSVGFIVLLAGPGVPGIDILREQSALIMRAQGAKETDIQAGLAFNEKLFGIMKEHLDSAQTEAKTDAAIAAFIPTLPDSLKSSPEYSEASLKSRIKPLFSPWFKTFLFLDPRDYLRKVHCPVLAVNGSKDLQVPPDQNLPEIEKALKEAGNKQFVTKRFDGLNHLFQKAVTGSPNEYATIEETFSPDVLHTIQTFIDSLK
jgi:pimeloyl-ACP methyl ester carboxylesterase